MQAMKRVCIIGAGPSGLVTARHLLKSGKFAVTIYEKANRLGGIWALDETSQDGILSPETPVNLSRFTVGFSDLDWNSVDISSVKSAASKNHPRSTPMFPKAWQVNRYLQAYQQRYVPGHLIHLSHEVLSVAKSPQSDGQSSWQITTMNASSESKVHEFDQVVIASGFFSSPRPLEKSVESNVDLSERCVHSSELRSLAQLFPNSDQSHGRDILMIGGGNSSGEAASAIAAEISEQRWSPVKQTSLLPGTRLIHVIPRPLYALPPYNESDMGNRSYMPLDFKLYNLSKRPPGPTKGSFGRQTPEFINFLHNTVQGMLGSDQSDLSPALVSQEAADRKAAYFALSEAYPEYVRSGAIDVKSGRVISINANNGVTGSLQAVIRNGDEETVIHNIGAVVNATGYTPATALTFLADDVKKALHYDPTNLRIPLILDHGQTINSAMPTMAFVGWYEGPFWPVMEMQARSITARWSDSPTVPGNELESFDNLTSIRQSMRDRANDIPQYWYADYVGHMEEAAQHLGLLRNDGQFAEREGCPSPARYISPQCSDRSEADSVMKDLYEIWHDCLENGRYTARAVFRAMQGNWNIERHIESADPNFNGVLRGTASFHSRTPSQGKSGHGFDLEYLYIESGDFTTASGYTMTARKRYVYRYAEATDKLSVWFVKPSNDLEVDYLFHNLDFVSPAEARKENACVATADHLCVKDMYTTEYRLPMKGVQLPEFTVKHAVKGPHKDYVATTRYTRPPRASNVNPSE